MEVDISMETSEKKYFYIFCTHTFRGLSGPSRTVCRCLGNGDGLGAHYGSYCMRSWGRRRQTSCGFMCVKMIYLSMCISDNDRNTVMNIIKNFFCGGLLWIPGAPAVLCLRWRYSGQSLRTWPMSPHWKQRLSFGSLSSSFMSSSLSFSFFLTLTVKKVQGKTRRGE